MEEDAPPPSSTLPPADSQLPASQLSSNLLEYDDEEESDGGDVIAAPRAEPPSLLNFDEEEEAEDDERLALTAPAKKKKKLIIQDDDEDEDNDDDGDERNEDDNVESRPRRASSPPSTPRLSSPHQRSAADGDLEEDEDEAPAEEILDELTLYDNEALRPPADGLYYTHLPRFLHLSSREYLRFTHDDKAEQAQMLSDKQINPDAQVIRWRYVRSASGQLVLDEQGEPIVESNTRLVEYEDGSLRLFIGSDPVDVVEQTQANEFVYVECAHSDNDVERCLTGLAKIKATLNLRPSKESKRTQSDIAKHLRQLNRKTEKTEVVVEKGLAPEREQEMRIKEEETLARIVSRKRNREMKKKAGSLGAWDSGYLEEGVKSKRGGGSESKSRKSRDDGDDDESEAEEDEEEEDELEDGDSDESDFEPVPSSKSRPSADAAKKKNVVESSDDEEMA